MDNSGIYLASSLMEHESSRPDKNPDPLLWPELNRLLLESAGHGDRRAHLGGSDANVILSADVDRIVRLWREKRGELPAEDLSDRLPVMLGSWTEPFNRQWFEKFTGHAVERVGEKVSCREHAWRRCTLDGFISASQSVFEAKHTNAFATVDEVLARYMPQLQHNMSVTRSPRAILSVIFGNHKFEIIEIGADWLYQEELLQAEQRFWQCVRTGEPPIAAAPPPPPKAFGTREVCLEGNNVWAAAAADWLKNREAAKAHAAASSSLKQIVEDDVARAFGHGIEAKRSKSGAITIREMAL